MKLRYVGTSWRREGGFGPRVFGGFMKLGTVIAAQEGGRR